MNRVSSLLVVFLLVLISPAVFAVYLNPNGHGEVLLYPFYSVEGGNDTYISVVNTKDEMKAIKVRFHEAMVGKRVFDFNLYLSPDDHWTAVVTDDPESGGARLITTDTSCTVPEIPAEGVVFSDTAYSDDSINGLQRAREGYVQVFEQGIVVDSDLWWSIWGYTRDCSALFDAWGPNPDIWGAPPARWEGDPTDGMSNNTGGLYGHGVLINVMDGIDMSYRATALGDFSQTILHSAYGSQSPDLSSADPTSTVILNGSPMTLDWRGTEPSPGVNAVSSVLMALMIRNDHVLEPTIHAGTDFLIGFPTKHHYTDAESGPYDPFTETWDTSNSSACEGTYFSIFDREGMGGSPDDVDFGISPPGYPYSPPLCYASNLITLNSSDVLHSSSRIGSNYDSGYDNGSVIFDFGNLSRNTNPSDRTLVSSGGVTLHGLPAIGFAVQKYVNGDVDGLLSNYAGLVEHVTTQEIELP